MPTDPRDLLPRHKSDCDRAAAVIALGYPAVAPILGDLLEWLRDGNWPVSRPIGDFLASLGEPALPHVATVMAGGDPTWKYWCIKRLIERMPPALAERFRPELVRLVERPTVDERHEELHDAAGDTLRALWPAAQGK